MRTLNKTIIGLGVVFGIFLLLAFRFIYVNFSGRACFFPSHRPEAGIEVCLDKTVWVLNTNRNYWFWEEVKGADEKSFKSIPGVSVVGLYRDDTFVYAATDNGVFRVEGADPESVQKDPKGYKYCWSDKHARYCDAERVGKIND